MARSIFPIKAKYVAEPLSIAEAADTLPEEHRKIYSVITKEYNSEAYKERRENMDRWLDQYKAELWKKELVKDTDSKVQKNYIFSNIAAVAPLLTDNKPIWNVLARDPRFQRLANVYGKASECLWDNLHMDEVTADVVTDSLLWPIGLTKTYWDPEEGDVKIDVVDPRTFFIAPGYDDLWKAPWCGTVTELPISWIALNYPDKLDDVRPETLSDGDSAFGIDWSRKYSIEKETSTCVVYEIWMRDSEIIDYIIEEENEEGEKVETKKKKAKYPNGRLIIMTKDVVLKDDESPFEHGHPPYVAYYDYKVPHSFWGMGEPQQIEYLHIEYNKQLRVAMKHSRLAQDPNYSCDTNAGVNMTALRDRFGDGGQMFPYNGGAGNYEPVRKIDVGQLDRVVPLLIEILKEAIDETGGVNQLTRGMAAKKERQSASEVSIMIESSYTRIRLKVRNLEASTKRNLSLVVSLMQQNYIEPKYFSYREATEEGDVRNFMLLSNSPQYFEQLSTPERATFEHRGKPRQEDEKSYQARLNEDTEYQEAMELVRKLGKDTNKIDFKFDITVETNSTLPQDKQTLVNTLLRLAEIQVSPNSIVDDEAVIGPSGLNIPNHQQILARKRKEKERILQMKSGGRPQPQGGQGPMPGPRPVPVPQNPAEVRQPQPETA